MGSRVENIMENLQEIENDYQCLIAKENLSYWDFSFEDYLATKEDY